MKKTILIILVSFLLMPVNCFADTYCNNCVVMDLDSGRILYENNKDKKMLIASTTKIMTAVIAIENNNLDEIVTVGEEVLPMYGTNIYIEVGEEISLRDLLYGLILRSGNDAAVAIAKHVGNTEEKFVDLMNAKAKVLGMNNTIFKNPHGLDEKTENYSTPYDMAKLMKYANTLMDFVEISGTKKWSTSTNKKSYVWYNRNKLLKEYKYLTGGKTGYTPKAGKSLVSTASKDKLNLVAVTINDPNHYETQKRLYDYIYSKYKSILLIDKNNISFNRDNLYVDYNFSYPLTEEELEKIQIHVDYFDNKSNKVGELYVTLDDQEIFRENIYIKKEECKEKGIFSKILDFIHSLFS